MKKRIISSFICALSMISLIACSAKPAGDDNDPIDVKDNTDHITVELTDNLSVDAEVTGPKKDTYDVYLADQYDPEAPAMEEVISVLYKSKLEELTLMTEGDTFAASLSGVEGGIINPYKKVYAYTRNEGKAPYEQLFFLSAPASTPHKYWEKWDGTCPDELDGLSKRDAIKFVQELGKKLQFNLADEPIVCYALDQAALKELSNYEEGYFCSMGTQYEWQEDDECYYMIFQTTIQDEVVASSNYTEDYNAHKKEAQGSFVGIVVREDKEVCWLASQFGYHVTDVKESGDITVQPQDIPELVRGYYDNTILESKHTVTEIEFCYIPNQIQSSPILYEMIPGYQVTICVEGSNPFDMHEIIYINAITGEEF